MEYRTLGTSGLHVSSITLGTMTFGTPVAEADSIKLVHGALDQGINFIDTANAYEGYARVLGSAGGVAEEIVGKALSDRRDKAVVATKVCAPVGPGAQDCGLSATHIMRALDDSLRRLQTDYIDLYIIHWPDRLTPLETTLSAMETAMRQGKIRYFGASNHSATQLCELLWLADKRDWPQCVSSQIPYSLLRREMHHDLAFCEKHGIGVTPYQSLQGGLLTGKYRRGEAAPAATRAADKPDWLWPMNDALFDKLEGIEALAQELGVPMVQYALAATLAQPAMSSLVVGVTRMEQIEDAIAAADITIPAAHLDKIDELCALPWTLPDPVRGPRVMPVGK
jgi:aryl-alcohol dehydrogenase-like predicted oxidoreductase